MKEIELTPKAEEALEAIWNYSFRQFGVVILTRHLRTAFVS
jgi:toxin ParE1/3/4